MARRIGDGNAETCQKPPVLSRRTWWRHLARGPPCRPDEPSIEFGADDEAAILPAAIERARHGPRDLQTMAPGAELADRDGLPGAPVGALLERVLEMERETARAAADPQPAGTTTSMIDAVVPQLSRRHDGGLRVVNPRRSGEIADALSQRTDIV